MVTNSVEKVLDQINVEYGRDEVFAHLRKHANLVRGVGNVDRPSVMFIGEAPGEEEDAQGVPFVGKAGRLLNEMLYQARIRRSETYVTNVIKYRPTANRTPTPGEIAAAAPYLHREILAVDPLIIVLLGRTALNLLFPGHAITSVRGKFLKVNWSPVVVVPMYHPAACLRDANMQAITQSDLARLRVLMDKVGAK